MKLNVKKLNEYGNINAPAKRGDAGYDVFSTQHITLFPGEKTLIPLGIAVEFDEGYMCRVENKSGIASKTGLLNVNGIIDSSYRGEIKVIVYNLGNQPEEIKRGQKIAQLVFYKIETPSVNFVDELSDSDRGEGGFGSTGLS
jgi:dUTP pyrophosphatase